MEKGGQNMKIGIIQAASQKDKNQLLKKCVERAVEGKGHEVISFGVFPEEESSISYVQTAVLCSMLLGSKAVDFIVTGCSSGQGMMLALNALADVLCGFVQNPSDAYLFGRINDGNAVAYPLGLSFGWAAEINLQSTMDALFSEEFGTGYPKKDADRKKRDTLLLKEIADAGKKKLWEIFTFYKKEGCASEKNFYGKDFYQGIFGRRNVCEYILEHGKEKQMMEFIKEGQAFLGE